MSDHEYGKVTQTSPLRVRLDTSTTDAPAGYGALYTPVVGHKVLVVIMPGNRLHVVDRVLTS